MTTLDAAKGFALFRLHQGDRKGINRKPELAQVCLICGSIHVERDAGNPRRMACRNCGFVFLRYECKACAQMVDSRDPGNPHCPICRGRRCACGQCDCPPEH